MVMLYVLDAHVAAQAEQAAQASEVDDDELPTTGGKMLFINYLIFMVVISCI
jgi:hypothetical protein